MKPKEKALNIIELFWTEAKDYTLKEPSMSKEQAIQCALIAVDEILEINKLANENLNYKEYFNDCTDFKSYWQEVKQEIELTGGDK